MRGEFRVIRVDNDIHDAIVGEIGVRRGDNPYPAAPQSDLQLIHAFARLYRALDAGERLETEERLYAFLLMAVTHGKHTNVSRVRRHPAGVRRARELLHARLDASLSLDELSRATQLDKFTLLRAFSRELGITPHAYLMQLRMSRACQLIAQGSRLADVALAVGYSEQSALNRVFKHLVGVTPGEYARVGR